MHSYGYDTLYDANCVSPNCILMQDASNWETGWRRQIGLAVAGGQVSRDADKPNLGMSTAEIKDRGGIPPSELSERGFFTARFYREVVSVSIPYLNIEERKAAIARLPQRAKVAMQMSTVSGVSHGGTVSDTDGYSESQTGESRQNQPELLLSRLLKVKIVASMPQHRAVEADTRADMGTCVSMVLEHGQELSDELMKYLHQQGWSPTKIAESRGVRGRKQVHLERVYAALGIKPRSVSVGRLT